ncbi:MAG: M24 family metallopeptidase [Traorella sp.]
MRLEKVKAKMREKKLDQLVICDPSSIDYLLGYVNHPGERMYVLLISLDEKETLFMNRLFYLDRKLDVDLIWYRDTDDYIQMLADKIHENSRVGIDKYFCAKFLLPLMGMKKADYVLGSECVDLIRMVKDSKEQEEMIASSKINDCVIDEVMKLCIPGDLSEREVSKKIESLYQKHGCSGVSFEPIVAFGKNGADNHHEGDNTMLKRGDSIILDIGGLYHGYCSDMTRTFFYQEVSEKQRKVYELVLRAQEAAEKMIRPGVRLCDIDACARDIIASEGYVAEFNHRLGHFIGKDVHEWGDVSANFDLEVEEGMIFSIEPGVYIKNEFGVRIEDLVLVTHDGYQVLNAYPKELKVIGNE